MSAMFNLEGKKLAVVGAASGIGEAIALGCALQGAHLVGLGMDLDVAARTASEIAARGGVADHAPLCILDGIGINAAFEAIRDKHCRLLSRQHFAWWTRSSTTMARCSFINRPAPRPNAALARHERRAEHRCRKRSRGEAIADWVHSGSPEALFGHAAACGYDRRSAAIAQY